MANEYQRYNGIQEQVRPRRTGQLPVRSRAEWPEGVGRNTARPERHSDSRDSYYNPAPAELPESADFSPEQVHLRTQQAAEEQRFWTAQDALTGVAPEYANPGERPAPPSLEVFTRNQNARFLERYPSLLGAAVQAGLTQEEAQAVVNWTIADQAAQRLMTTQDPDIQLRSLLSMSEPMRVATMSVIQLRVEEGLAPKSWLENSWNWMWDNAVDPVLGTLETLNEGAQHTLRAMNVWTPTGFGFESAQTMSWTDAWDMTEQGKYDQEYIKSLREQYNPLAVDVLLDAQTFQRGDAEDPIGLLWDKYSNNPEALRIIDQLMQGEGDAQLQHLASLVDSAHMGDLGNIVANNVLSDETRGTVGWTALDKTANAVGVFGLDPTIVGAKARGAYITTRYALAKVAGTGDFMAAFNQGKVRRFWDTLGRDLQNVGTDGLRREVLRRQYGKWLTDDTIEELRRAQVYNHYDAMQWLQQQGSVDLLLKGQPARRGEVLMPRMSASGKQRRKLARGISERNPLNRAGRADWEQFGSTDPGVVGQTLMEDAEQIGRAVGVTDEPGHFGYYKRADAWPYSQNGWARRVDRWMRQFSRTYSNAGGIKISDASQADEIYRYSRTFLTRYHATQVADAFRRGDNAERFRIVQGLNRTAAYAFGIDIKNGVGKVDELAAITRPGARYAPVTVGMQSDFEVASIVNRDNPQYATTPVIATGSAARDARLRSLGAQMADLIARRQNLNSQISEIRRALRRERGDQRRLNKMDDTVVETGVSAEDLTAQLRILQRDLRDVRGEIARGERTMVEYVQGETRSATATSKSVNRRLNKLSRQIDEQGDLVDQRVVDEFERLSTVGEDARREAGRLSNKIREFQEARQQLGQIPVSEFVEIDPANFGGRQMALYPFQASDRVAIPDIRTLQELRQRVNVLDTVLGWTQSKTATNITDWWSLLTLAGPRYALRNAIEDWLMYALTNGSISDLYRGRRVSTALRTAGRTHGATLVRSRASKPYAALGFFNRNWRRTVENATPRALAEMLIPHMGQDEITAAVRLARRGEYEAMGDLAARAWMRSKLTMSGDDVDMWIDQMVRYGHAGPVLDELIELSRHMLDGTLPGSSVAGEGFGVVRMVGNNKWYEARLTGSVDPKAFGAWYHRIDSIIDRTGIAGKVAIANLENRERAIQKITQAINDDPDRWANRMAAMNVGGATAEEMARRVYADVLTHFSGPNGNINFDLLSKVRHTVPTENGNKVVVSMRNPETGRRLRVEDLLRYKEYERPKSVIVEDLVEEPLVENPFIDNLWQVLGEQHNRIAREPIFYANYIGQRRNLQWYEDFLVNNHGLSRSSAARAADRVATDRAYDITMSYTDNPKHRTLAAWNAKNISRYYRATEDFYRRVLRLVQNNPEALWKLALTYDVVDHSGFIFTGDDGEKYFVYPGMKPVMQAMAGAMSILGDRSPMIPDVPMMFTGRVDMLTPSLNKDQMLPTFAGPLGALPMKLVLDYVPGFKGLERAVMGEYSESQSAIESVIPMPLARLLRAMDRDERNSQYASAFKNAVQIATAAGLVPEEGASPGEMDKFRERIGKIAESVVWTRFFTAWSLPAAATAEQDNTSQWAKLMGVPTMRSAYRQIVDANDGDWDSALAQWWAANPDNFPYTVSQGEVPKDGTFMPAARATYTPEWALWMKENAGLREKFPTATTLIAPVTGDKEDWSDAYQYAKSIGLRTGKTTDDFFKDVTLAKGKQVYYDTKDDYEAALAGATSPEEKKAVEDRWTQIKGQIYASYPGLREEVGQQSERSKYAQMTNDEVGAMLSYIYGSEGGFSGQSHPEMQSPATKAIASAYLTYQDGKAAIAQISGNTRASQDERKQIKARLTQIVNDIGASDPNAQYYVNSVLRYVIDDIRVTEG